MLRTLLIVFCLHAFTQVLQAQTAPYNPYAPVQEDPPIGKDGKINWPPYFRSAKMEQKYQGFFQAGSCVGTGKRVTGKLAANQVDTNALPRVTLDSQIVQVAPGSLGAVSTQGAKLNLVIHPKGVSQVEVLGEMLVQQVVPGMIARFQGAVDESAKGAKPIESLEIISLTPDLEPIAVEPERDQTILGKVIRHQHLQFVVNVGTGKMRQLTFLLPEQARVSVQGKTLDLVAPGDVAHAEGLLYTGLEGEKVLFAEKLVVRKTVPTDAEHATSRETAKTH
ncbi:hypothetical protein [Anatilimnocola floriformis]|uniref:hypothetical protein n=1 Tax=Anatilimnocola floriformis TaxID=2948575 RepID=UPI0020C21B86|nr:hypothetical protein [Anatilimnocola floriformis]